jgi:phosphatidylglycerol---prolipoprotein diacylglyceryl transferase
MPFFAYYVDQLSPFLIRFGNGWGIRYYGLAYALGFVLLYFGLHYQIRRGWCRLKAGQVDDYVFWIAFAGVVLGGRLGYCLLYDWPHTAAQPWSVFQIWKGGMASHGGITGVILVMLLYGRRQGIPFYNLADATALCAPLGLGLGRCANFINGELWGRPATVPWAVIFPAAPDRLPRHPSQLYEALGEGLLLFLLLAFLRIRTKRDGVVSLTFVGGYALARITCECFREPDEQIGYWFGAVTQGQLLSSAMVVLAAVLAWIEFRPRSRS